jgi:septal ring factor EnvC (AmiA/AmiB activator)
MGSRCSDHRITAWLAAVVILLAAGPVRADGSRDARLRALQAEIAALESEVRQLRTRERGVLGELERLGAELRLLEKEVEAGSLRLDAVNDVLEQRTATLESLHEAQDDRRRYLAFRLRELYRAGPEQALRRIVGGSEIENAWTGLRYAAYLSERDRDVLNGFRKDTVRLSTETDALRANQRDLAELQTEIEQDRSTVARRQRQRTRLLEQIRDDQVKRQAAIDELQGAAIELTELVDELPSETAAAMDMGKFRGLLDWPAEGRVSAGFGTMVHPRFKTRVPHPGLDIEGEVGDNIRSVFAGEVAFAAWMRGYGLTAIVDHGNGLLSIYAHASALLVGVGQPVLRGQTLGKVGDTGSLRGPFLYFELRVDGKATDPLPWLRSR